MRRLAAAESGISKSHRNTTGAGPLAQPPASAQGVLAVHKARTYEKQSQPKGWQKDIPSSTAVLLEDSEGVTRISRNVEKLVFGRWGWGGEGCGLVNPQACKNAVTPAEN